MTTHQLAFIASAGGQVITDWLFACSCGETFQHPKRAGAKAAFAVHAHTENSRG